MLKCDEAQFFPEILVRMNFRVLCPKMAKTGGIYTIISVSMFVCSVLFLMKMRPQLSVLRRFKSNFSKNFAAAPRSPPGGLTAPPDPQLFTSAATRPRSAASRLITHQTQTFVVGKINYFVGFIFYFLNGPPMVKLLDTRLRSRGIN